MPNHCFNSLGIKGEMEDVREAVKSIVKDGKVDFNLAVPMPKEYEVPMDGDGGVSFPNPNGEETDDCGVPKSLAAELDRKYGYPNWYSWCCANWGTKWNAYGQDEACIILDDTGFPKEEEINFLTAWAPPHEWLKRLSEMFPKLEFTLSFDIELGNGKGTITAREGEMTEEVAETEG